MNIDDPAAYGEACAEFYDLLYPRLDAQLLALLRGLADGQPVLELGAGTGRVVRALARAGLEVWALDASPAMLRRLRARCAGMHVHVVEADMAAFELPQRFGLITLLVDTLDLLPAVRQPQVFQRVAQHLQPGGQLLVERFGSGSPGEDCVQLELHTAAGPRSYRVQTSTASPGQHQAWAEAAGLELRETRAGPGARMLYRYSRRVA